MHFITLLASAAIFSSLPYCSAVSIKNPFKKPSSDKPIPNVYASFQTVSGEIATKAKFYKIKQEKCIILTKEATKVVFKGGKKNKNVYGTEPMCLHFYHKDNCVADNAGGDYTFQYQDVKLDSPNDLRTKSYALGEKGLPEPKSLKFTRGKCSNPKGTIGEKNLSPGQVAKQCPVQCKTRKLSADACWKQCKKHWLDFAFMSSVNCDMIMTACQYLP
ncbi:hypothetical protein BDU57DRAFT_513876 [Ampelomyces quisqualis]|uniref:Uncharacterized protein n=1 Tax=Ampelomyces quisqualis TaxID=50730 RepID=A0A6A5QQ84_AMPQU|nr:hypothetical protein BDU57DRAFT_513876 [Ampelomyces quisqualis]